MKKSTWSNRKGGGGSKHMNPVNSKEVGARVQPATISSLKEGNRGHPRDSGGEDIPDSRSRGRQNALENNQVLLIARNVEYPSKLGDMMPVGLGDAGGWVIDDELAEEGDGRR